jgi:hypothetical protein
MSTAPEKPEPTAKLPWTCQLAAGWPILLVILGGALGGGCGGAAYAISISLFKKHGVNATTYLLSVLIGIAAIAIYLVIIVALAIAFPNLFKR